MLIKDPAARLAIDRDHIWHPYSAMQSDIPVYLVASASGVRLRLADGRELIDGMSSWWCAIHGYNHPRLNQAINTQLQSMSHVMFGGLTHEPAIALVERLVELTPDSLQSVFLSDSGSVAVEVAMKLAIQYWNSLGLSSKQSFLTLRNGYHGDTFAAMSVCDPVTGMHSLFNNALAQQFFLDRPSSRFGEAADPQDLVKLEQILQQNNQTIAALILEPIVQGAGGMYFYSADFLHQAREICDRFQVLLIADEIATGFGRSGRLFACEHAAIEPDIMCLGKSMTGGYLSLAATLTSEKISSRIDQGNPGVFMHGPTFMGNPLACAVSRASIDLLLESNWQQNVQRIEKKLKQGLAACHNSPQVAEVRVLGAIGVVEMKQAVNLKAITTQFVDEGVWVRPFGKLVYLMPAFNMDNADIERLCDAIIKVVDLQSTEARVD